MFRIGEFSKLARVSIRTLRHYDEIGLLVPDQVGPENGYRYYSAQQLSQISRIQLLREMGAESADLSQTFGEIEDLAWHCRFRDCTHTNEPGCAVLAAVEQGRLDQRRLESYRKLEHESSYKGLSSKELEVKKAERMFREVGGMKQARRFAKEHYQRKRGKFPGGGM